MDLLGQLTCDLRQLDLRAEGGGGGGVGHSANGNNSYKDFWANYYWHCEGGRVSLPIVSLVLWQRVGLCESGHLKCKFLRDHYSRPCLTVNDNEQGDKGSSFTNTHFSSPPSGLSTDPKQMNWVSQPPHCQVMFSVASDVTTREHPAVDKRSALSPVDGFWSRPSNGKFSGVAWQCSLSRAPLDDVSDSVFHQGFIHNP